MSHYDNQYENDLSGCGHVTTQQSYYSNVEHPEHYTNHPSGIECIQITQHMNFCLGNAFKYLWRAGMKGDPILDLKKAVWYIQKEIKRRQEDETIEK